MIKIKMLKDACYNSDGKGIKSTEVKAGNIYDVPEWVVETFVKKMKIAELVKEQKPIVEIIETPSEPVLEMAVLDLSNLEYKELKAQAESKGFKKEGKGSPSKDSLIKFLTEANND